ncbi:hypothetical protein MBLNU457_6242t1 [Dothideomycetes sp. NU457]
MSMMALTEHIPRGDEDLYPDEETHPHYLAGMYNVFDDYYQEATRLQKKYADQINILIGFEGEWIRPGSLDIIQSLLEKYRFDLFVGSVHHVHTIPIDYDDVLYHKARDVAGGTDEKLFEDYFDAQYEMLQALKPPVVAHFDLIRLKADDPDPIWTSMPQVWARIMRNLGFIATYGGFLEINTSALRKGLQQPYPRAEICDAWLKMKGRVVLSDDSHGISHIGTNYGKSLQFMKTTGISEVYYFEKTSVASKGRLNETVTRSISIAELENHKYWQSMK